MMKAVFINGDYTKQSDLIGLNNELKDCKSILKELNLSYGTILIVDTVTRKDKLEKINESSNLK